MMHGQKEWEEDIRLGCAGGQTEVVAWDFWGSLSHTAEPLWALVEAGGVPGKASVGAGGCTVILGASPSMATSSCAATAHSKCPPTGADCLICPPCHSHLSFCAQPHWEGATFRHLSCVLINTSSYCSA